MADIFKRHYSLTFKPFGENALLIEWPARIEEGILYDIINLQENLKEPLSGSVKEYLPAYSSLTLFYDPATTTCSDLSLKVAEIYKSQAPRPSFQPKLWHIPVCYDPCFGIDLDHVSKHTHLSQQKIIELHCQTLYTLYFIGFLPGFLYLGGLPEVLHTPRKSSPRQKVLSGAVAIGGNQTGIYPLEKPGGWNIIGNSPIRFLNTQVDPPVFSNAGDKVAFFTIDKDEHDNISEQVTAGTYELAVERYIL